jgi:hypothetical protein
MMRLTNENIETICQINVYKIKVPILLEGLQQAQNSSRNIRTFSTVACILFYLTQVINMKDTLVLLMPLKYLCHFRNYNARRRRALGKSGANLCLF